MIGEVRVDVADRIAITELLGLYGHVIDARAYHRIDELFTPDAVFDTTDFGHPVVVGSAEIAAFWIGLEERHPVAHHSTNVVITLDEASGEVRVESKGLGVTAKGRVGSCTYSDVVVRRPEGWRLARRVAVLSRPRGQA